MPSEPAPSLTQAVYEELRIRLVRGVLRPGDKLKIADLCQSLSGNLSAVREALARLTSEGLVTATPQRGYRVAPIAPDDLIKLTEARVEIEALCLRSAIAKGDIGWETGVVAAHHTLKRVGQFDADGQPTPEGSDAHDALHRAFVAACDNHWLLGIRDSLAMQSERYRWMSARLSSTMRDLPEEHRVLAETILARDVEAAVTLMGEHLRRTTRDLLRDGLCSARTADRRIADPA